MISQGFLVAAAVLFIIEVIRGERKLIAAGLALIALALLLAGFAGKH